MARDYEQAVEAASVVTPESLDHLAETVRDALDPREVATFRRVPATDALDALLNRCKEAEARAEVLEDCDCVYAPVSSSGCWKCGRRGVITHEHWLEIIEKANAHAAAEKRIEELEGEREALTEADKLGITLWQSLRDANARIEELEAERDALAEAQQFPVETVMSWKRRAEALSGLPVAIEAELPATVRRAQAAEAQLAACREALRDVPYAITMALQWTLVPSDVPAQMVEPLGEHRKMLARVHDAARRALSEQEGDGA